MNDTQDNTHQGQTSISDRPSLFGLTGDELFPQEPLFKFLSTAPGTTPDWKTRVTQLLDGKAYLPSPSQFNDPFDCVPTIGIPSTPEEFATGRDEFIRRIQKAKPGLTFEDIASYLDRLVGTGGIPALVEFARMAFDQGGDAMGVFCLCECAHNVLMWSHYANNHQGLALRFNFAGRERSNLLPLWKVKYQDERPRVMRFFNGAKEGMAFMEALCTKADFWRYEQEWRFLEPNGAGTIREFDPVVIDGVILGAKMRQEDAVWMIELAQSRKLPIMHVVPDRETFGLTFDGLWKPAP